jgi:tetratricopeptide (TPR) repeat protein
MFHRCPKCQKKIGKFSLSCQDCGWSLDQELNDEPGLSPAVLTAEEAAAKPPKSAAAVQLEQAVEAISREDFPAALGALNAAIVEADESCLPECYALRGYPLLKLRQFDRAEQDCSTALQSGYDDVEIYAWRAAARGQLGRWREAYEDLAEARDTSDEPTEFADLMAKYYEPSMNWFRQRIQQPETENSAQAFSDRGWVAGL